MEVTTPYVRQVVVPVSDASCVGECRRQASGLSMHLGFGEPLAGNAALVTTELATNLHRYATGGEMLLQAHRSNDVPTLDIFSIDRGPGVADVLRAQQDGFSTGGSAGEGLGAVRRMSSEFDMHSCPAGTVIFARIAPPHPSPFAVASVCRPFDGETVSGDTWAVADSDAYFSAMVADGLGHGLHAAEAANAAHDQFLVRPWDPPEEILSRMQPALTRTRGAAVLVVRIDRSAGVVRHAGIGNVGASVLTEGGSKGLVSMNGIVGGPARRPQAFESPWSGRSTLVMFSDGLRSRWGTSAANIHMQHHPAILAGVLSRDLARGTDDLTVLVVGAAHV